MAELTVTINAKLDVDRKTAETCLRLVEAYVNANNVFIMCDKSPNGEVSFWYEAKDGDEDGSGKESCARISAAGQIV